MSDQSAAVAPAGWYPEPGTGERMRWWSGADWTDQYADEPAHPAVVPRSWGTAWVWVLAFMPWVSSASVPVAAYLSIYSIGYEGLWFVALLLPWLVAVAAAALDVRRLRLWGHSAVASWAWSLLGAPVYVIARTVRLRAGGRTGLAPLWTTLANVVLSVLAVVLAIVTLVALGFYVISELSRTMP